MLWIFPKSQRLSERDMEKVTQIDLATGLLAILNIF